MGGRKDKIMDQNKKLNNYITQWYDWIVNEVKRNIAKGIMSEYAEDLVHHVLLDLYKLKDHKAEQMIEDDKMRWYVLRGCALQLKSSTSPFYRIWRREKMNSRESGLPGSDKNIFERHYEPFELPCWEECFNNEFPKLHFYQRTLLEQKFMHGWTFDEINDKYNISKVHLTKDINEALLYLRNKCSC